MKRPKSSSKQDIDEWKIYEDIKGLIMRSIDMLKAKEKTGYDDIALLEKITRIYANLKDDLREDAKADIWKKAGVDP